MKLIVNPGPAIFDIWWTKKESLARYVANVVLSRLLPGQTSKIESTFTFAIGGQRYEALLRPTTTIGYHDTVTNKLIRFAEVHDRNRLFIATNWDESVGGRELCVWAIPVAKVRDFSKLFIQVPQNRDYKEPVSTLQIKWPEIVDPDTGELGNCFLQRDDVDPVSVSDCCAIWELSELEYEYLKAAKLRKVPIRKNSRTRTVTDARSEEGAM